jgi:hypothetical protein
MYSCPFSHGVDQNLIKEMKGNKNVILKIIAIDEEKRKN